jgi:branched-chain amino acid transport system substrate-binding protein
MKGKKKGGWTRRDFVKTAAVGTGVMAAGISFPAVITRAGTKDPIRIGCLMDITGALYTFGIWGERSTRAAVDRINAQGGINGRPIKLFVEDSATNVQTALRKLRKLIMEDRCDFILGPCNSGIAISAAPQVESMDTIFFSWGTSAAITGKKGNRYIFRGINNVRHGTIALGKVALKHVGKRYYCLGADYEWGRSLIAEFRKVIDAEGGEFKGEEFSPVGTEDFLPYLNKINPKEVDILVAGYFTADLLKLARQASEKGLIKHMEIIGGAMPTGLTVEDLGPAAEHIWFTAYGLRRIANIPEAYRPFNKVYRDAIGLDDEGRSIKDGKMAAVSYSWAAWEHVFWVKRGIEKSGWRSKDDNEKFMKALEGMSVEASVEFPQGPKTMRAQDHQVFTDQYVTKIEGGKFVVKGVVKAEDLMYEPEVDYTKQKI